jgi:hypothetical protein
MKKMKKLSLDLDRLAVESFDTAAGVKTERGTVQGHLATDWHCTNLSGCCFTDWESCYGGCSDSGCDKNMCYME